MFGCHCAQISDLVRLANPRASLGGKIIFREWNAFAAAQRLILN
jgi:hypothetical protein